MGFIPGILVLVLFLSIISVMAVEIARAGLGNSIFTEANTSTKLQGISALMTAVATLMLFGATGRMAEAAKSEERMRRPELEVETTPIGGRPAPDSADFALKLEVTNRAMHPVEIDEALLFGPASEGGTPAINLTEVDLSNDTNGALVRGGRRKLIDFVWSSDSLPWGETAEIVVKPVYGEAGTVNVELPDREKGA